jgi:hypothetical protein
MSIAEKLAAHPDQNQDQKQESRTCSRAMIRACSFLESRMFGNNSGTVKLKVKRITQATVRSTK